MGLSISPEKIVQMLLDRGRVRKEQIATFLDSIALESRVLADIWQDIYSKLQEDTEIDSNYLNEMLTSKVKPLAGVLMRQSSASHKLTYFYRELSNVIGGKVERDMQERFYNHLSSLLAQRKITRGALSDILSLGHYPYEIFLDEDNYHVDTQNLSSMIEIMQKEAAAIDVLAKAYRARM